MIRTRDVSAERTFEQNIKILENFLSIKIEKNKSRIRINSIFNKEDKSPSMFITIKREDKTILYKDFSTGKGGTLIEMIADYHNKSLLETEMMFKSGDDTSYQCSLPGKITIEEKEKWELKSYTKREWCNTDERYFGKYNISEYETKLFNVMPLYEIELIKKNVTKKHKGLMYAFHNEGKIYKIYFPLKKKSKRFMTIRTVTFTLKTGSDKLIRISSIKDAMALHSITDKYDIMVEPSETFLMTDNLSKELNEEYTEIINMMDNDLTGKKKMVKEWKEFGYKICLLKMEKDISDSIMVHGKDKVEKYLKQILCI